MARDRELVSDVDRNRALLDIIEHVRKCKIKLTTAHKRNFVSEMAITDGVKKYKTNIKDGVFIGSNSSLVAPVKLGKGSYTGAGSVITKNVGRGELAVGRGKQVNLKRKKK